MIRKNVVQFDFVGFSFEDQIALELEVKFGTLRHECLDRLLIWNERHPHRILAEFTAWYNQWRVHQGLHGIPDPDPALSEVRGPEPGSCGSRRVAAFMERMKKAVAG